MSMEHKAYVFDTERFHSIIEPIIIQSSASKDTSILERYISEHINLFYSPYSLEPLDEKWTNELEKHDLQEYFDFLLTACYDGVYDIGLENVWEIVIEIVRLLNFTASPELFVLGYKLKYNDIVVDPGYMGLGIIEAVDVEHMLEQLKNRIKDINTVNTNLIPENLLDVIDGVELSEYYITLCKIYEAAYKQKKGLLFTF